MTAVPFSQCCHMLTIDAKTLRQWLKYSNLSPQAHPTDARIKCLTLEQLQQLAALHGRSLMQGSAPIAEQVSVPPVSPENIIQLRPVSLFPSTFQQDSALINRLSSLEATVTILQQQVTQLALELLQERTWREAQRLQALETLVQPTQGQPQTPLQMIGELPQQENGRSCEQDPRPTQRRARSSLLPLIEYGARGTYVVISPEEGELLLTPDSQDWFDWLETLSSFRFLGQMGRFSTYRNKGRASWIAYRRIHGHRYDHALGSTPDLTISSLEQMAAQLQSSVPSL